MDTTTPSRASQQATNQSVIAEFRANAGRVGGPFEGLPLMLLTTRGTRTGKSITTPVTFVTDSGRWVIIANKGEDATVHPDWYHNLLANPDVTVELGSESFLARATVLAGAERERHFARIAAAMPSRFAGFLRNAHHEIPVILLERIET